ncbi:hypothetical protein BJV77DRAFT_972815 [Russula vinacea]|nr:hypothetical protein BJV77DRAFT_972815 [Russula vinacea]
MLALQGTLTVAPFHCISSSMDEYALESGHVSRSGSMEWRARAPTPRQHTSIQPQVSPQRADLASTMSSADSQIRTHPNRPLSTHPPHRHHEHSRTPPSSASSASAFAQPHAYEHRQDRPQRPRIRGSVGSAPRARTSRLGTTPSQERLGKRKRRASAESGTPVPQTVATHRDTVGPQRSHRRHHNVAEKTHSTMLPSGGMFMTFPLDIPSPEPETESSAPAGPPPFEHGPSELPPRPYEPARTEGEGSGPERTVKRGRLPADVMDHLPTIEGRLRKIEDTVKDYLDARNKRALDKSKLPGSQ